MFPCNITRQLAHELHERTRKRAGKAPVAPVALKKGDRVAIVAPSSAVNTKKLADGIKILQQYDLEPVLGTNVRKLRTEHLTAAPIEDRVKELTWAFDDDSIDAVMVANGGFGCAQLLPQLPYDVIASNPKLLMGYSDVTALNNALLAQSNLVNINGPSASIEYQEDSEDAELVRKGSIVCLKDSLDLLMSNDNWGATPFKRNKSIVKVVHAGKATGHAIGGNLDTLVRTIGTPYFPNPVGAILFLEDIGAKGYDVLRGLWHLKIAGILDQVSGVVFGEFVGVPKKADEADPTIEEVIVDLFEDSGTPCIMGLNFSHGVTIAPIPIGADTTLDADDHTVSFDFYLK